ncbi:MAG: hypothetical protein WDO71_12855 [Bacteroidota bacterium]
MFYRSRYQKYATPAINERIQNLNIELSEIKASQADNFAVAKLRIERSDFLLYRIKTVSHYPLPWIICTAMIILFLFPGYLIYSISNNDTYYKLKHDWERKMISEEYSAFSKQYTKIFKESFNLDRTSYTVFVDPPFNEKRKEQPSFQTQSDFLKKFSGE